MEVPFLDQDQMLSACKTWSTWLQLDQVGWAGLEVLLKTRESSLINLPGSQETERFELLKRSSKRIADEAAEAEDDHYPLLI